MRPGAPAPRLPLGLARSDQGAGECLFDPALGAAGSGLVDLSVGTPVDPTPAVVRAALAEASDAHGYPLTWGTADLREAVATWFAARRGVPDVDPAGVLPTIGSKELVAWLPLLLGLGPGDVVAFPRVAYPTYDVGARLAGATPVAVDALTALGPLTTATTPKLLWLNTPGNPTGKVLGVEHLAKVVAGRASTVSSWPPTSATPSSTGGRAPPGRASRRRPPRSSTPGSPAARTRACCASTRCRSSRTSRATARAFVAGDPALVGRLLEVRKHAGMMVPWPVQRAVLAALSDADHVVAQKARYAARRAALLPAVEAFGLRVDDSEAGLYLWATAGEDGRATIERLATRGILAAPGDFYGPAGRQHVRIALTATDERVAAAVRRLA